MDEVGMITVDLKTFMDLVKDSTTLQILKQMVEKEEYFSKHDFMAIVGMEEGKED